MRKREENIFTMYKTINSLLSESSSSFSAITAFQGSLDKFNTLLNRIERKDTEFRSVTAGKTKSKDESEKELITKVLRISQALILYASSINNIELREKATVRKSELERKRDMDLLGRTKELLNLSQSNAANLTGYGVSADFITELSGNVSEYESKLLSKEASFADKSAARTELSELFRQADEVLKNELDGFAELIKDTDADLYNLYKNARYIKNLGVRHDGDEEEVPAGTETEQEQ